jgi:hypothetical protein
LIKYNNLEAYKYWFSGKAEELGGTMSQRDADPMQADQVGIPLCTQARTSLPFLGARMYRSEHISAIARIVL